VLLNDAILFLKTYLLSEGIKKCPEWFKSLCDKSGTDAQSGSFEELAMPLFDQFRALADEGRQRSRRRRSETCANVPERDINAFSE
jgi:hypothetical protein